MAPRLEVLTLRGLANRGKIRSTDPALNNLVALPNELICQVLAFWNTTDEPMMSWSSMRDLRRASAGTQRHAVE